MESERNVITVCVRITAETVRNVKSVRQTGNSTESNSSVCGLQQTGDRAESNSKVQIAVEWSQSRM
jgi:hypothetical protein